MGKTSSVANKKIHKLALKTAEEEGVEEALSVLRQNARDLEAIAEEDPLLQR